MFHTDTDLRLQELCEENKELASLMKNYEEENKFLLSRMTHEIRNPLTLIYSTLQLIEKRNPAVRQISYWPTLTEDMKDIFSLLDNLSDFNHSDSLHKSDVNLLELLTDLKVSFEPMAKQKDAMLTILLTEKSHVPLQSYSCDHVKMKQAFTNLIKNAIEAVNTAGTVQIKASLETPETRHSSQDSHTNRDEKKTFLCIAISNTGSCIAKEDLDTIFLPFKTTKQTGSGLGLPITNRIVSSHGGFIRVSSDNTITTFSTYLPLS